MKFKSLNLSALFIVWFIFCLNFLANKFYLYSSIWWFDMMMHFLGGVFLAFLGVIFLKTLNISDKLKTSLGVIFFVVIVGLFWEFFEVGVDKFIVHAPLNAPNIIDSLSDLAFDFSGGVFALLFIFHTKDKNSSSQI